MSSLLASVDGSLALCVCVFVDVDYIHCQTKLSTTTTPLVRIIINTTVISKSGVYKVDSVLQETLRLMQFV